MSFIKEFKEFAIRGNVIDLAVGVIIGGAFGKIVSSLVADIIMPPIGYLIGGVNFTELKWSLGETQKLVDGVMQTVPVTITYGNFLQTLFDFIIVAFCIFLFVKLINKFNKKNTEEAPAPAAPTKSEELLMEIRDLLKK
jgi:large conductance mechanosensitive channel